MTKLERGDECEIIVVGKKDKLYCARKKLIGKRFIFINQQAARLKTKGGFIACQLLPKNQMLDDGQFIFFDDEPVSFISVKLRKVKVPMKLMLVTGFNRGFSLFLDEGGQDNEDDFMGLIQNREAERVLKFFSGFRSIFPDVPVEILPDCYGLSDFEKGKEAAEQYKREKGLSKLNPAKRKTPKT
jgi:hypothetical protein